MLLLVVLVLHVLGPSAATAEETGNHVTSQSATSQGPETTPETMIMPDGSVVNMDDMGSTAPEDASTGSAGSGAETSHHSMGGPIDWRVIVLILALLSVGVALATAINEYLRHKIAGGAFREVEATDE